MEQENANQEQQVVILGCTNEGFVNQVKSLANDAKMELVMLDDKVVHDYIAVRNYQEKDNRADLEKFLSLEANKIKALEQARKLFTIVTKTTDLEKAEKVVLTEMAVCSATTLSHSKANQLFGMLKAFGIFEWVNIKKRTFVLHFDQKFCTESIRRDIKDDTAVITMDLIRYKKAIETDATLSEERKLKMISDMKEELISALNK